MTDTPEFFKSSYSEENGNCVEATKQGAVRDSKDPEGPVLRFSPEAVTAFARAAGAGEFGPIPEA